MMRGVQGLSTCTAATLVLIMRSSYPRLLIRLSALARIPIGAVSIRLAVLRIWLLWPVTMVRASRAVVIHDADKRAQEVYG